MKLVDKVLANTHLQTPSLTTLNGSYTTEELLFIVKRYEDMLKQFDIAGKRIALLVPSIKEFIPLVLTINKLGGVAIPLNWQFREEDLLKVLTFINPHIIFTVEKHSGFDFEETIKTWSKENNGMTMVYTSSNCEDWQLSFFNGDLKPLEPTAHNFICCTSGSTGTPKGMVFNQGIFDFSYNRIAEVLELSPKDTVLVYTSTSTVFGIKTMTNVIKVGANAIVPTAFDLPTIINEMKNSNCNKIVTTPSVFKALHTFSKHLSPEVIDNLELVCLTGEKMPDNLLSNFPTMQNCKFVSQYGISEVGAIANSNIRLSDNFTIARGVETKVVDGELYVKTGAFFTAYYGNEQLTNEAFDEGWFKTGDLVEFTTENTFKIVGREKEMIKKGGQQVIPSEVEVTILSLEGVKNVTVLGTPHQVYGEQVVAFVVVNKNAKLTTTNVRSHCKGKISAYKIPDKVIFIDELPILQGKVDKRKLKETIRERNN